MNHQRSELPHLSPKAALLLACIAITAIDGNLDEREIDIINRLDGFKTSDDWDNAIAAWNATSVDEAIPLIAHALSPQQQRVTIANMVDIAMADSALAESENILLRAFAQAFDVSDSDIEQIVDVITMKNNAAIF